MKTPRITVLTTVYNGEEFLDECITSILNQQFTDYEFLIIDDGSTDHSRSIIQSYNDPRIILVQESRIGRSKAVNAALTMAKGKYVAFLDADDISSPDRLGIQYGVMESNAALDLVGSFCAIINERGLLVDRAYLPTHSLYRLWRLQFQCNFYTSSVMLKKSAAIKAGMFPEELIVAHDYKLFLDMAGAANTHMIPRFLCEYRMYSGRQLTKQYYGRMIEEAVQVSNAALRDCHAALTDAECLEMRPIYWVLERKTVTPDALRALAKIFDGFCKKFAVNDEAASRLATRVAADILKAGITNCDGPLRTRIAIALEQVKGSPWALPTLFSTESLRVINRVFKRTRFHDAALRALYR